MLYFCVERSLQDWEVFNKASPKYSAKRVRGRSRAANNTKELVELSSGECILAHGTVGLWSWNEAHLDLFAFSFLVYRASNMQE